jgi:peptidoglycan hydrolase-like protein with peptidoglycan-binding domain
VCTADDRQKRTVAAATQTTRFSTIVDAHLEESRPLRSQRQRHYIRRPTFLLVRPLLRYSTTREAYVLRIVGGRFGPVVRIDRRTEQRPVAGPDRRRAGQLRSGQPG